MTLNELILELKQTVDWPELQIIAEQITQFGSEAIYPLISILKECAEWEDYIGELNTANKHSIAEDALVTIGTPAVDALIPLLNSMNWGERFGAIYCLHHIGDPRAIEPMILSLDTAYGNAVGEIAEALKSFGETSVIPLLEALKHSSPFIRGNAACCAKVFDREDIRSTLTALTIYDSVVDVRINAMISLNCFRGESITKVLVQLIRDENAEIQELAQELLDERIDRT